jgi:DNA integrity scanning protein DisA with diadenylate cyclase activity
MVAPTIEAHFAHHIEEARKNGEPDVAVVPEIHIIEAIIDATFWASLHREEGHSPRISLAYMPPEHSEQPLIFEQWLPLTPRILTKLSPGFERPGIHLGVWHSNGELYVWGATLTIPEYCFVLDVSEPGLLVIKHRRIDGFGKFVNVAVLIGEEVKIIDENSANLPDCPALLNSLLGFTSPSTWDDTSDVLVQLAVSMRAHKRGGSLLVVPTGNYSWRESIIRPIKYSVVPAFSGLAELMKHNTEERHTGQWRQALKKEVDIIAGLTAIDGAIIISEDYELLAFGAKIRHREGGTLIDQIVVTEPILGGGATVTTPEQSGGTRHLSAAQFVHDQRNALGLVASQDGRFTVFSWSPCEQMVHAHRIDSLLL